MDMKPTRIVINRFGEAVGPKRTDIEPDIIFIRNDGWSLGAPKELARVAFDTWSESWTHVWIKDQERTITINQFLNQRQIWI
jgi:hypothetical protein